MKTTHKIKNQARSIKTAKQKTRYNSLCGLRKVRTRESKVTQNCFYVFSFLSSAVRREKNNVCFHACNFQKRNQNFGKLPPKNLRNKIEINFIGVLIARVFSYKNLVILLTEPKIADVTMNDL